MKRFQSLLLVVVFTLTLFAVCGPLSNNSVSLADTASPVKLVFATNEQPQLPKEFWQIPTEKFMKANPNVTIENIAQPSSNVTLWDYEKTLLATGQFPDILIVNSVTDLAPSGALLELSRNDLSFVSAPEVGMYKGKYYFPSLTVGHEK